MCEAAQESPLVECHLAFVTLADGSSRLATVNDLVRQFGNGDHTGNRELALVGWGIS